MAYQEFSAGKMDRLAKCLWSVTKPAGREPFEILPDSYRELLYNFGGNLYRVEDGNYFPLPDVFAVNLLEKPVCIQCEGMISVLGLRLFPWTTLGFIKGKIPFLNVPEEIMTFRAELGNPAMIDSGLATQVLNFFGDRPVYGQADRRLILACESIANSRGVFNAAATADAGQASSRNLQRLFRKALSESPKSLSRKVRFEFVRDLLWHQPKTDLTWLSNELDFTDTAHFSREFRKFSGKSPGAFARAAQAIR